MYLHTSAGTSLQSVGTPCLIFGDVGRLVVCMLPTEPLEVDEMSNAHGEVQMKKEHGTASS